MTTVEKQLWDRLERFTPDMEGAQFTFAKRLARENGWSQNYTDRVIEEYKKFLFMCCVSSVPVTPSDPVDQTWHLHLTYTKSYWNELCRNTLGKEIHHNPTQGGLAERVKFENLYTNSRQLYHKKFGTVPPSDIWEDNEKRFGETNFRRVNCSRYWLVPKPSVKVRSKAKELLLHGASLLSIQAVGDFFVIFLVIIFLSAFRKNGKGGNGQGCSSGACSGGCTAHGGDSGCSGCSGCGGCGGGD